MYSFLLATDNFNVSKDIKWYIENKYDMQAIYDDCMFIAKKFLEYDKRNYNTLSQYDSLANFVIEYENEIKNYFTSNKDFKIRKEQK